MASYFYPTYSGWFETFLENWKDSGKRELVFPFLRFEPHTLPPNEHTPFWMYIYYSKAQTPESQLQKAVKFRVRVIQHSTKRIVAPEMYTDQDTDDTNDNPTMWFRCDVVEELRRKDGQLLRADDFEHAEGIALLQAIRNSIAPVKRITECISVQTTQFILND